MTCLLCLRNEGVYFPSEASIKWKIFLALFSLPTQFSQSLEGNPCCSRCRIKLQFAEDIIDEIRLLNAKLKYFEKEVKDSFVRSFEDEMDMVDELSSSLRLKILNEITLVQEVTLLNGGSMDHSNDETNDYSDREQTYNFESLIENSDNVEDPLQTEEFPESEAEELNEPANRSYEITSHCKIEAFNTARSIASLPEDETSQFSLLENGEIMLNGTEVEDLVQSITKRIKLEKLDIPKRFKRKTTANRARKITKRKMRNYTCIICEPKEEFVKHEEYEEHLTTFHSERVYSVCKICSRIVLEGKTKGQGLRKHMQVHNKLRPYNCPHEDCDAAFRLKPHLEKHNEIHKNREIFICDICPFSTLTGQRNFNTHMYRTHGKKNYNCKSCGFNSDNYLCFNRHAKGCGEGKLHRE